MLWKYASLINKTVIWCNLSTFAFITNIVAVFYSGVQFLKKNRKELIQRIVAVELIADELRVFIDQHKYEKILQAPTEYKKNRQLFDIIEKSGTKLQLQLYACLLKHEKYLVEDLDESP